MPKELEYQPRINDAQLEGEDKDRRFIENYRNFFGADNVSKDMVKAAVEN